MPMNSTSLPVGGMPMYSPWWVARDLQRATTLSPSAMRSSMVLITSGKPRRKSAASCLAASAWAGTKSPPAASRLPVWFQSSSCSLRTSALFSSTDKLVSSYPVHFSPRFPHGPQHTAHDATRRYPMHPDSISISQPRDPRRGVGKAVVATDPVSANVDYDNGFAFRGWIRSRRSHDLAVKRSGELELDRAATALRFLLL